MVLMMIFLRFLLISSKIAESCMISNEKTGFEASILLCVSKNALLASIRPLKRPGPYPYERLY